ncbi:MAG: glycosyltransferase family 39 protein, partial [Deltaproteobacteria bacterium]|nr:glycosyltransferase family 39 protein [Deltaproteobacteria bacterium]
MNLPSTSAQQSGNNLRNRFFVGIFSRHALIWWGVAFAFLLGAWARLSTSQWGLPFRYHIDELGFVMWVAAHMEWRGLVQGSFDPQVTHYGPLIFEAAIFIKWLWMGVDASKQVALLAKDGWEYLHLLDDPTRTPLTMSEWIGLLRIFSATLGSFSILLLVRVAKELGGPKAALVVAWLSALAPGLIQVSHFYTTDSVLFFFEAMLLDAASKMLKKPSLGKAIYAGLAIGGLLATKSTGAFLALGIPWVLWIQRGKEAWRPFLHAFARASLSWPAWVAAIVALGVLRLLWPWPFKYGLSYFEGSGPTSGAFLFRTLYEKDFDFFDWRFVYRGQPKGIPFFSGLIPYALGWPAALAGYLSLFALPRRARLFLLGFFVPTALLVSTWTVQTIRYAIPLLPPLLVGAACVLSRTTWVQATALPSSTLAILVLIPSILRGLAWTFMFFEEDPRTLASRWIASHAQNG